MQTFDEQVTDRRSNISKTFFYYGILSQYSTLTKSCMSNKYEKLLSWARSHGAVIPDTLIFPSEPYGHCRTIVPIERGTQLFHIPHNIILTPAVATTALPQLCNVSVHAMMCCFIALERDKEGFWKDYLDSLPRSFSTPPYFDEKELDVLKGTNLSFAWRDCIQIWKNEYEDVKCILETLEWYLHLLGSLIFSGMIFYGLRQLFPQDLSRQDL